VVHGDTSKDGRWLAVATGTDTAPVWDHDGPVDVEPLMLRAGARTLSVAFDATSSWLALQDHRALTLWPLTGRHPHVLRGPEKALRDVAIDPGGRWIAAGGQTLGRLWIWPQRAELGVQRATLDIGAPLLRLAVSPRGDLLAAGTASGVWLIPIEGGRPEQLPGFKYLVVGVAFDHDGKRLAAGGGLGGELNAPGESVIRIWDLDTRSVQVLDAGDGHAIAGVEFTPDGRLLSTGMAGLRQWDLKTGTSTVLMEGIARAAASPDGHYILGIRTTLRPGGIAGTAVVYDLHEKRSWELPAHGTEISSVAWHPSGRQIVTGSRDGIVRVGDMTGEEPHLLIGHEAAIWNVAVEPAVQRIASTGDDGTVRLWRVPEGQPLHTLPSSDLLARLRSLTNYRIVEDAASPSGYRLDFEPFTGWNRKPPSW
jgi:WD40 repeat protein